MQARTTSSPSGSRHHPWLAALLTVASGLLAALSAADVNPPPQRDWSDVRSVAMQGDWRVFWNVGGGDRDYNNSQALARGFRPVTLLNTFADYPGGQRENIATAVKGNPTNPWRKPEFFERIVRRNIAAAGNQGEIFVHDIEFQFTEDIAKAWSDPDARAASAANSIEEFSERYFKEWATWFWLPAQWAREVRPTTPIGIYGPQPFRRDYWGIAGKTAQQIDGTHRTDAELWRHIDPHIDFYVASVYVFYDDPGSIYYIAANVEENYQRTRRYGDKPLYAYQWLRYHNSNKALGGQELPPYIVEAMAVIPYFSGADGIVLWGWEPGRSGQHYSNLPLFAQSLGRLSGRSDRLSKAELVIDEPAHVLWRERRPLLRTLKLSDNECVVLAVNPWQSDADESSVSTTCGDHQVTIPVKGRHTGLFEVYDGRLQPL